MLGVQDRKPNKSEHKLAIRPVTPYTPFMLLVDGASSLGEVKEDDAGRIANGCVVTGEGQVACFAVHIEDGDVVVPLVARIKEPSRRVEIEAARIIPTRPFFANEL